MARTTSRGKTFRIQFAIAVAAVVLFGATVTCGGSSADSEVTDAPVSEATRVPSGPVQVIEHVEASSKDGVLFDIKLALPVFDHNGAGGKRDDAEVVSPDKTEYQGIFPDGPGTLLIVSCFADVCQTDARTATFEIHYWIESAPDSLPDGVSLPGG